MALFDREYYRDETPPPRLRPAARMMVTNLVILNVAIYVVDIFLGRQHWLMASLSLSSADFASPWLWWRFLTYGFAHMPYPMLEHIFWNMLGLWMFGRDVELLYGRRELLTFYLVTIVFGSLVWALRYQLSGPQEQPSVLLGASGAVTAVVLLFVFHYPKRTILLMFVLPVPAWVMGVLIIGGDLMQMWSSSGHRTVAFDVHLAGAAFAIAYYRFGWNLSGWFRDLRGLGGSVGQWKPKPRLKVVKPDEDDIEEDEEADRLLIKVRDKGMSSLTAKERRTLEAYSRRMRQKHQSS
jgi:membrane associated rhomboid family serine protease